MASVTVARADGVSDSDIATGQELPPALCFMSLDDNVNDAAMSQLRALPALQSVSIIHQL